MTESMQRADYVRLLREALPFLEATAEDWNDWATEEDNRRHQWAARHLADRIRAHIDGTISAEGPGVE